MRGKFLINIYMSQRDRLEFKGYDVRTISEDTKLANCSPLCPGAQNTASMKTPNHARQFYCKRKGDWVIEGADCTASQPIYFYSSNVD